MIIFQKIIISNFYSIGYIEYDFVKGVHKLSGENGNGKTSICAALYQCLFNKNIKSDGTIDSTYNVVTGKPYKITVTFLKGNDFYEVCNDRGSNTIRITVNGKNITPKGVKQQLKLIQTIIGVDYNTFTSITYLSQTLMSGVFNLNDTNNIINKFFDVSLIKDIEKNAKTERRDLKKHIAFLNTQVRTISNTIDTLDKYVKEDVTKYIQMKEDKQDTLNDLLTSNTPNKIKILRNKAEIYKDKLYSLKEPITKLKTEVNLYSDQLKELEEGVCPTCGSNVETKLDSFKEHINNLNTKLHKLNTEKEELYESYIKHKTLYEEEDSKFNQLVNSLKDGIATLDAKITLIEEKNKQIEDLKHEQESLIVQKKELEENISLKEKELIFIDSMLGVISSGAITKQYVASFITTFNSKLEWLVSMLDLSINVKVYEENGKIIYHIVNNGKHTEFSSLSSGEKTRVSLVVLLGIIQTLETLTNVRCNILIFDELLSVLDKNGVDIFKQLLNLFREEKCMLVVIHHDEINEEYFDTIIKVSKKQNLTEITINEGNYS